MITGALKNHYGSTNARPSHNFQAWDKNNPIADINNNSHIKDKTRLFVNEGLFATYHGGPWEGPQQWRIFPDGTPNSLFFSFDPVAIDSVLADYIIAEHDARGRSYTGHYTLHYAAENPYYSLGIHEHKDPQSGRYRVIDYQEVDLVGGQPTPTSTLAPTPSSSPGPTLTPSAPSSTPSPGHSPSPGPSSSPSPSSTTSPRPSPSSSSTPSPSASPTPLPRPSLTPPSKTITVTAPNGGELWESGTKQKIRWTWSGPANFVRIDYSLDDFTTITNTIVASTTNTGVYTWTVPEITATLRLRVADALDPLAASDVSDGYFLTGHFHHIFLPVILKWP